MGTNLEGEQGALWSRDKVYPLYSNRGSGRASWTLPTGSGGRRSPGRNRFYCNLVSADHLTLLTADDRKFFTFSFWKVWLRYPSYPLNYAYGSNAPGGEGIIRGYPGNMSRRECSTLIKYNVDLPASAVLDIQAETTVTIRNTLILFTH